MIIQYKLHIEISLIILSLVILLPMTQTYATIPSNVRICDPSIDCTQNMKIALISHSSTNYLTFAFGSSGGFFNSATVSGKTTFAFINFTSISLISPTNPSQSFGVSLIQSNATLTTVTSDEVSFTSVYTTTTFTKNFPKLYYYYDNQYFASYPSSVTVANNLVSYDNYYTNAGLFNSCTSSCVYINTSNNTIAVKDSQVSSSNTITLCTIGLCQSELSTSSDASGFVLLVLLVVIFIFLNSERKKRRDKPYATTD